MNTPEIIPPSKQRHEQARILQAKLAEHNHKLYQTAKMNKQELNQIALLGLAFAVLLAISFLAGYLAR